MTKTEAYAIRNKSRRMICAFVAGMLTAVVVFTAFAAASVPSLRQVPVWLFWTFLFLVVYRFRARFRRLPVWLIAAVIALEAGLVAFRGFDIDGFLRREKRYEELSRAVRANDVPGINRILREDPTPDYVPAKSLFCSSDQACYSENNERPVDIAIDANNLPVAQLLADHGATVGPRGADALNSAAKRGDLPMLRFLLANGVDINAPSGDSSALRNAVDADQPEAVAVLLYAGANPNSRFSADGHAEAASVLHLAQDANLRDIVLLLRQAGATE